MHHATSSGHCHLRLLYMHPIMQGQQELNVMITMSSSPEWRVAAVKLKGFRSVAAWLEVDLPRGNLIGIVGPNGGSMWPLHMHYCHEAFVSPY